jgi:hypothetical protein
MPRCRRRPPHRPCPDSWTTTGSRPGIRTDELRSRAYQASVQFAAFAPADSVVPRVDDDSSSARRALLGGDMRGLRDRGSLGSRRSCPRSRTHQANCEQCRDDRSCRTDHCARYSHRCFLSSEGRDRRFHSYLCEPCAVNENLLSPTGHPGRQGGVGRTPQSSGDLVPEALALDAAPVPLIRRAPRAPVWCAATVHASPPRHQRHNPRSAGPSPHGAEAQAPSGDSPSLLTDRHTRMEPAKTGRVRQRRRWDPAAWGLSLLDDPSAPGHPPDERCRRDRASAVAPTPEEVGTPRAASRSRGCNQFPAESAR